MTIILLAINRNWSELLAAMGLTVYPLMPKWGLLLLGYNDDHCFGNQWELVGILGPGNFALQGQATSATYLPVEERLMIRESIA